MKQVRVRRPIIVRQQFETPSWYRDLELKPGVYPMKDNSFGSSKYLIAHIPGIVVSSAFPSSFGGLQFGDGNVDKDKGREETWVESFNLDPTGYWDQMLERHDGAVIIEELPE